jgi:PAS domain S-box-containing protein
VATLVAVEFWQRPMGATSALWTLALIPLGFAGYRGGVAPSLLAAAVITGYVGWHEYMLEMTFSAGSVTPVVVAALVSTSLAAIVGLLGQRHADSLARLRKQEREAADRESSLAAVQNSRAEHRNIFNSVPAMIWFKDPNGIILRANRRAAESIGKRIDQVEGSSTWDLYPIHAPDYQRDDLEVIRTGRPKLGIIERYETPDGAEIWVRTDKIPLRSEDNEITGVIVFAVDITEHLSEQQRLKHKHDELQAAVVARTKELEQVSADLDRAVAERQRMAKALQHGEQRLQAIMDHSAAIIYLKDQEGRYVLVNRRYEELFHARGDSVIGKTDQEIFPPALADAFRRNDQVVLRERRTKEFEELAPHDDGLHTYISLKFPVFDAQNELIGICGISTDITERKQMEERLRLSEARLRTMTDTIAAAAFIFQGERLIDANPAAERITGYSKQELIGRDFWMVIHPEDREKVRSRGMARQKGEVLPPTYEVKILRKDGQIRWVSFTAGMIEIEGNPAVFGTAFDITDRKRIEDEKIELLHVEERVAAVSKMLLASGGKAEALNEALLQLLEAAKVSRVYVFENFQDPQQGLCTRQTHEVCAPGVTPQIGNPVLQALPYRPDFARWEQQLSSGEAIRGIVREMPAAKRAFLEKQDIQSILVIPIHAAGQWYGFIGFDDTRSERHWTDADIHLLRTAGEMMGAYLARERTQEALRQAVKAAEAASKAKSQFLGNISHEIKTPISSILLVAESLRRQAAERQEQVRQSEVILRNGRHLLALLNDLLDLSLIEAGRLDVEAADCSLFDIIADVEGITAPLAQEKSLNFKIRYVSAAPSRIRTDRRRLTQAIINLVNNAVKYTEEGFVEVRVSCEREARPQLVIAVEDSGIGIEPVDLERIFETFTQVRTVSQQASEGAGLGLSIARWIAVRLGGWLRVASESGRGSTFTITVPLQTPPGVRWIEPTNIPSSSILEEGRVPPAKLRLKGRILLADDADDARLVMQTALGTAGAEVIAVADGAQAVDVAKSPDDFDLILLDLRMPNMDGEQAVAELRRRGCRGPIIALTAHVAANDRAPILNAGFDDVWSKPITLEQLLKRTADFLPDDTALTPQEEAAVQAARAAHDAASRATFLSLLPGRMQALRLALEAGDYAAAMEPVHKLAGAGGTCGFMGISDIAGELFRLLKDNVHERIPDALARLEAEASRALSQVEPT